MSESPLKILSGGAVKRGVAQVAKAFECTTGTPVTVEFDTAPEIRKRVAAGETADVFVVPPGVMDEFQKQRNIVPESRGLVGRSRVGVVVHAAAGTTALGDTAAFKRALLNATAVVYNTASSGLYCAKLMERLGIAEELKGRIVVVDSGAAIMEAVASRAPGAIGLAQISEVMVMIEKGCAVRLAAPLPAEIQNMTSYDAAASAASKTPEEARRLAESLRSSAAKKIFAATGID